MKPLIIGTRGSQLALIQAQMVADRLHTMNVKSEIRIISTEGDRRQDISLRGTAGVGLFVREIEKALLHGEIDLAVHSLKDLPVDMTPGLKVAAFLEREDPREAFIARNRLGFEEQPVAAVIGSSSLRRVVQLQKKQPQYQFRDIRGNVDTRLRKLDEGLYDGIILAVAGLKRLGYWDRITQIFTVAECLPAVGQGVIGVQVREDFAGNEIVAALNHGPTEIVVRAERAFLDKLGGGCRLPVGAWAEIVEDHLRLTGMVANVSGDSILTHQLSGASEQPETVGVDLAEWFIAKGIIDWC